MIQSIIAEMRPQLQACNIFIITEECLRMKKSIKIMLKTSEIDITWNSEADDFVQKICLPECRLIPHSLSALQVKDKSMSFRLQTLPLSNIAGSLATEVLNFSTDKNWSDREQQVLAVGQPYRIKCRCCGKELSKDRITMRRVLPLPSASWESEDWFCHRYCNETEGSPGDVKVDECLLGCCYVVFNALLLAIGVEKVIRCTHCLAWLGTRTEAGIKMWRCTVGYTDHMEDISAFQDFVLVLQDTVNGSFGALRRLVVECRLSECETQYLLIWVMDFNLKLFVNIGGAQVLPGTTVCKSVLQAKNVMKVLYLHHQNCNAMVQKWQQDLNIPSVDVAKQMFLAGLDQLTKATECIPEPNQILNNFFVSYLELT